VLVEDRLEAPGGGAGLVALDLVVERSEVQ
jgi:hypothetical protein